MTGISVVPAILPESFEDLTAQMAQVKGLVPRVQVDIVDGIFAPSKTWPYTSDEHFEEIKKQEEGLPFWQELDVELDMMVERPERVIDEWVQAGVAACIVHHDSTERHFDIFKNVKMKDVEAGIAIKPSTPTDAVYPFLGDIDFVQVMGNDKIGYHGVELDERVYEKVRKIRAKDTAIPIAVDIGVNEETAPKLVQAGVTKLVSGSGVFGASDMGEAIEYFQSL